MDNCWTEIQVDKDTMVLFPIYGSPNFFEACVFLVCVTVTSRPRPRYSCLASLDALSSACGCLLIGLSKLRRTSCQYTYS